MKNLFYIAVLLFYLSSCKKMDVVDTCNVSDPLTKISWVADKVKEVESWDTYTQVSLYNYKGETFIAFENVANSGPAGYIFNCDGLSLPQLEINYNDFYEQAKLIKVLAEIDR